MQKLENSCQAKANTLGPKQAECQPPPQIPHIAAHPSATPAGAKASDSAETCCRSIGRPSDQSEITGKGIRIEWPSTPNGRARTVITRSGGHRRYVVACFRRGPYEHEAHADAEEEANAFILLDSCAGVEFQEQPAKITFEWRGAEHVHFPDILVVAGTTSEFWECKKDQESLDLTVRKRTERLIELLKPLGFGYRLVTSSHLRQASFLENAIRMRRRARLKPDKSFLHHLAKLRTVVQTMPARKLFRQAPGCTFSDHLSILYACLYHGHLCADLRVAISLDMNIQLSREGDLPWVWQLFEQTN